jgi:dihydroxyacid dehydratase/phosphogluconate dehydratase
MFDSLAYRNDAAIVMRRLIRSLPTASGVLGIATCDKGLPATMLALAGTKDLPGVIVPGGVTLPARDAEDAGQVQSLGARFTHDLISLDYAAAMGCRACGSSGGGCQFLGTAATSQVIAEALGLALAAQRARAVGRAGMARAREPFCCGTATAARPRDHGRPDPH